MTSKQYPDDLNPFGSDDEDDGGGDQIKKKDSPDNSNDEYPDYLSPFGDDDEIDDAEDNSDIAAIADDYDNSLNPFCDVGEDEENGEVKLEGEDRSIETTDIDSMADQIQRQAIDDDEEFGDKEAINKKQQAQDDTTMQLNNDNQLPSLPPKLPSQPPNCDKNQLNSLDDDQPPKPLPRTKKLLRKEQAQKGQQQYQTPVPINLGNT